MFSVVTIQEYYNILKENYKDCARYHFRRGLIFKHDKNPKYRKALEKNWPQNKINLLPNLNPTENLWQELKRLSSLHKTFKLSRVKAVYF